MGRFIRILLLFLISIPSFSQQYGLIEDDSAYESLKTYKFDGSKADQLPEEYSLKSYTPYSKNQGSIKSCSSWAVVYGALSMSHAIQNNIDQRKLSYANAFMPLSVHNMIVKSSGSCRQARGTKIEDVLEHLKTQGALKMKDFRVPLDKCDTIPSAQLLKKARQHTISKYYKLFDDKKKNLKVIATKKALSLNLPVIIGFEARKSFEKIRPGKEIWRPLKNDKKRGLHAMVVVGYDDNEGCFELFNSWGNKWARGGFVKVRYKDFQEYCKRAFVFEINGGGDKHERRIVNSGFLNVELKKVDRYGKIIELDYDRLIHGDTFKIFADAKLEKRNISICSIEDDSITLLESFFCENSESVEIPSTREVFKFKNSKKSKLLIIVSDEKFDVPSRFGSLVRVMKRKKLNFKGNGFSKISNTISIDEKKPIEIFIIPLNDV